MATSNNEKRPNSFYELVLGGPDDLTMGFLSGLIIGSGHDGVVVNEDDEDIAGQSLKERFKEALRVHRQETQVVVDNVTRALVKKKAKQMFAETGIEILEDHKVRAARFEFRYSAYAPRYGEEIDALMKSLPSGVRVLNHDRDETHDPSARGPEAYAPVHDYELKGNGLMSGRFDAVLHAHHTLDTHPLVEVEAIELDLV